MSTIPTQNRSENKSNQINLYSAKFLEQIEQEIESLNDQSTLPEPSRVDPMVNKLQPTAMSTTADSDLSKEDDDYTKAFLSRLNVNTKNGTNGTPLPPPHLVDVPPPPAKPFAEGEFVPSRKAPERKDSINTLRAVANESTRNALKKFKSNKRSAVVFRKCACIGGALAFVTALVVVSFWVIPRLL